ncbi:K+/H+ antiporter [Campylobacter iguaniorum]|uniref:K+/H+ antiporter n=1 Tax=Campylobacter iguaniorum TaxID=1244531 RepID=A0A076FB86_9BACT|nr:potassium/proton antiporter [Campylobacter iguaniorum]AII14938.1 K+/H+ antiporter [Campylobacter iguaniorum]ALV24766.1 K+/H+ antiporter [Campylobacter iguaniorum]
MENALILFGLLFLFSVMFSKISDKYGVPALLMFLAVGMLAGSDGIVGLEFDNSQIAANVGTIALIYILFAGGFNTSFKEVKPVFKPGLVLATLGVVVSAGITGLFAYYVMRLPVLESFLFGAIISSTDAAAVFSVLRSNATKLKNNLAPLLEFESGSNDPMAIFLTMTILGLIGIGVLPDYFTLFSNLALEFILGGVMGYGFGVIIPSLINRIKLSHWGLYPVLLLALVAVLFGVTEKIGGNGYIAVYMAGIFANKKEFIYKKNLVGFFDGVGWMMQIFIFLTLGLLVFPSELPEVALYSFIMAVVVMFIARPISVFISLIFSRYSKKEKFFISWVGLRGVVPIILATYPLSAPGVQNSQLIFNTIFFMVLISVLSQGTTLKKGARYFGVVELGSNDPISLSHIPISYNHLKQFTIGKNSKIIGKNLTELELPDDFLILLAKRGNEYIKAGGSFEFEENDLLLILCDNEIRYQKVLEIYQF